MAYKRNYRRGARKGKGKKSGKKPTVKSLAVKVKTLATRMAHTQEVKEYTPVDIFANTVGQVDANLSGARVFQLNVMNIPAGVNDGERVGIQCKFIGMSIRMQLSQQAQAEIRNKYVIDIWRTNDFSYSDAGLRDVLYDIDSISGVVDANSTRNWEFIKSKSNPNGLFTLLKTYTVNMKEDQVAGQLGFRDIRLFIKQQQLLSYAGPSTGVPVNCRYFMVIRAQNGNRNTATLSTLSTIPILATNSGALVRFQHTDYFVDA